MSDRKRSLNDLRVIDLRVELEKRNLDKSGVRGVLIQRLSKFLEKEGEDPATFKFDIAGPKTPGKKTRSESTTDQESEETTPAMEDMIIQDDAGEDDDAVLLGSTTIKDEESLESMDVDEPKLSRKRESNDESESPQAKKPCRDNELKSEDELKVTESITDAEDSINLYIGDDELINEEIDNTAKFMKDEENEETAVPATSNATADDGAEKDSTTADDVKEEVNSEAAATSESTDEKKESDQTDDKDKEDGDKKEKKEDGKEGGARNLWVSGLSGDTRAKDLKQVCSKHGKVIGAKVVTNARTPGSRCYGYVTMASAQDAENCIKSLHRTELHGRMISVEKAKSESESSSRRQASTRHPEPHVTKERTSDVKADVKEDVEGTENAEKVVDDIKPKKEGDVSEGDTSNKSHSQVQDKTHRSEKGRNHRTRSHDRKRSPREVLSFSKIWKERDMARARERSRAVREEERRRRAAEEVLRERERRQRQEKHRLELEREKLRAERERIEREKNDLLRLERERHRLEREKLELERLELKRAQLRLEEERRKRTTGYETNSGYRKAAMSPPPVTVYERDARHKRPPQPPMMSGRGQFEAPPPPRFEMAAPAYERSTDKRDRDYKREYPRHVSYVLFNEDIATQPRLSGGGVPSLKTSNTKYPANGNTNDDTRQPLPPGTRPKEPNRSYETREGRSYRPSPPGKPEPRNWNTSSRYQDSGITPKGGSGEQWSSSGGNAPEARYGVSAAAATGYEQRYAPAYQPPPPGATYPDRYQPQSRDYRAKY